MKDKPPRTRRSRFLRWLSAPSMLGLLAIAQAILLVLLLLNLLKSPVTIAESPSPASPSAKSPVILSFAVPWLEVGHESWKALIKDFESKNPDIRIEVVSNDSDSNATDVLKGTYVTEFKNAKAKQAHAAYDLIYTDIIWVAEFASAGWLKDLSSIPQADLDLFLPEEVEAGRYQGKLYRLPFRTDVGLFYYRKDLLEASGYNLPHSYNELLTTAQALQNQKRVKWGLVWQGKKYEGLVANFAEVLQSSGGFWIKTDTREVGLDQPEAIAAAQLLLDTLTKGISPEDVLNFQEQDAFEFFKQKQTGFLRNWPYAWTLLTTGSGALSQNQVGVLPMVGGCRGGWGFAIAERTHYPEAALRAIQFFTSEAAQRQFILKDSYVPTIKKLFTDPEIVQRYPYFHDLIEIFKESALRPAIPEYGKVSNVLQDYLSQMLNKKLSPEEAMKKAAKETRCILNPLPDHQCV